MNLHSRSNASIVPIHGTFQSMPLWWFIWPFTFRSHMHWFMHLNFRRIHCFTLVHEWLGVWELNMTNWFSYMHGYMHEHPRVMKQHKCGPMNINYAFTSLEDEFDYSFKHSWTNKCHNCKLMKHTFHLHMHARLGEEFHIKMVALIMLIHGSTQGN